MAREELQPAITLNSIGVNVSRAIGPAIAGVIVTAAGSGAAFVLNALSFLVDSWAEHLRQHRRITRADEEVQNRARAFHLGPEPPRVAHLIAETS